MLRQNAQNSTRIVSDSVKGVLSVYYVYCVTNAIKQVSHWNIVGLRFDCLALTPSRSAVNIDSMGFLLNFEYSWRYHPINLHWWHEIGKYLTIKLQNNTKSKQCARCKSQLLRTLFKLIHLYVIKSNKLRSHKYNFFSPLCLYRCQQHELFFALLLDLFLPFKSR